MYNCLLGKGPQSEPDVSFCLPFITSGVVLECFAFSNVCPSACFVLELHRSLISLLVLVCGDLLRTLVLCFTAASAESTRQSVLSALLYCVHPLNDCLGIFTLINLHLSFCCLVYKFKFLCSFPFS